MLPAAVEAKSLSSLTTLASNPPAYPRNPTHGRHQPLVLYIARVPGSRDVFLSPMKPREKVVTAEDIQSSLYYVHVDQPEDARLLTPPSESKFPGNGSIPPNRVLPPPVQRKAVSASLAPPSMSVAPRKPVSGTLAPMNNVANRQNINAGNYTQSNSWDGSIYYSQRRSFDSKQLQSENDRPLLPLRRNSDASAAAGISLTLIRRDPASSAQWNVARIDDPPVLDVSSSAFNDPAERKKTGAPIYIEITNPGYSKFLNNTNRPGLMSRDSELSVYSQESGHNSGHPLPRVPFAPPPLSDVNIADPTETVFRRRLWMEGSRYANDGFGHRKNNSQDSSIGRRSPRSSFEGHNRERASVDLRPSQPSLLPGREEQAYNTIQVSDKQSSFRGYVFTSPWNGRCEFVTGTGGGSLKCRHVIPGPHGTPTTALPVSELRFNLPSSSKGSTLMGEESSKRSSIFHRPRSSRNNSSVSEMDLSLGQEIAGGGFGGKQAKLGKLIIEDEGLKMLDLLVAANMALWWRAYEKVHG